MRPCQPTEELPRCPQPPGRSGESCGPAGALSEGPATWSSGGDFLCGRSYSLGLGLVSTLRWLSFSIGPPRHLRGLGLR